MEFVTALWLIFIVLLMFIWGKLCDIHKAIIDQTQMLEEDGEDEEEVCR